MSEEDCIKWHPCIKKMIKIFVSLWRWLFSLYPIEKSESKTPHDMLLDSMRSTASCRFNASVRLKYLNNFSLFTATYLSLGLILIPLIQNTDIHLHFYPKVLNLMQVFLAVAVLVYSTINATARYDARSIALNECGDKVKDLIRILRAKSTEKDILITIQERYNDAVKDSENHTRLDYLKYMLEKTKDFHITGLKRFWYIIKSYMQSLFPFFLPTLMILIETIFILDMVGVTGILPMYLGGVPPQ
ncbi:SLATT domain-containing protein [Acinetobacter sp. NyZ410]|uniref:SLATT domain-containing protein n=1 Tax=Acinetobacter sp. NyZ410 TaxID=2929509 RepID=UPI001FB86E43|nr:SLATT domain-containing protein [Acinetobacter sp. NyZ410]UOH17252.1 SLATT domain-containing protein [Acinetobacter sp. NyZ410]